MQNKNLHFIQQDGIKTRVKCSVTVSDKLRSKIKKIIAEDIN